MLTRLVVLLLLTLGGSWLHGACGPVPNTYALYNSYSIVLGTTTVNNGTDHTVAGGGYIASGIKPDGTIASSSSALPDISPAKPASFGTTSATAAGTSVSAGTYSSLSLSGNVSLASGDYFINALSVADNTVVSASGTVRIFIGTSSSVGNSVQFNAGGSVSALQYFIYDSVTAITFGNSFQMKGLIFGGTAVSALFGHDMTLTGAMMFSTNSSITVGNVLRLNYDSATQTAIGNMSTCGVTAGLHHIDIASSTGSSGLTCNPSTLTLTACADAGCTSVYTGGVTGTLSATGTPTTNWNGGTGFTIGASGTVTKDMQVTTAGTVTLGASVSSSPAPSSVTTCSFLASCVYTAQDSGFLVSVQNHLSATAQIATISAVKKSDNSLGCTPALAGVTKSVSLGCSFVNPSTGTRTLSVGGSTLTCNGSSVATSLSFNGSGVASPSLTYTDVGQLQLNASYSGSGTEAGLVMSGSGNFIAAPAKFSLSAYPATAKAGVGFGVTVTAQNNLPASDPNSTTPNFGRESPAETITLSRNLCVPASGGQNGNFSYATPISFSSGVATISGVNWDEVGKIDLTATGGNYLGANQTIATGNTSSTGTACGALGSIRVTPDHFTTVVTKGCPSGGFTYSKQPFSVKVSALNLAGNATKNYDTAWNLSQLVTLSDGNGSSVGSFSSNTLTASAFSAKTGEATNSGVIYTFSTTPTSSITLKLRATDTDSISSATGTEGTTTIYSGRVRLLPAFGSQLLPLKPVAEVQYWNGSIWTTNTNDSCTAKPTPTATYCTTSSVNQLVSGDTTASISGNAVSGKFDLTLTKPLNQHAGYIDLLLDLSATDWLQFAWNGANNCTNVSPGNNPQARMRFGIFGTGTSKLIYQREVY